MDVDDATAKLLSLIDMGFDIPEAESALESASGNLETAISILTSARSVNAVPTVIRGEESPSLSGQFVTTEAFPRYPQDTTNEENVDAYQNFRSDQISSNSGERSERECCWDWKLFLGTVMFFSAIMIICGSFWMAWIFQNYSECGTSLASAKFTIVSNTTTRVLSGNSCPGYDWTGQSTPAVAGDISFEYEIPLNPVNCTSPQWVGIGGPVFSHIGYALNGVQIFSPVDDSGDNAITYEHTSFDDCGGHVHAQELEIDKLFPHTKPPGGYHYHEMPGDTDPNGHDSTTNLNFTLCEGVMQWYTESNDTHSPIMGFMLDGYPIYGPKGADGELPEDLDVCGGHYQDLGYYHYHFKSSYPYSVQCLWGKTNGEANNFLDNDNDCDESDIQWSYANTSLHNFTYTYGGSGANYRDYSCVVFLSISCALFLYALCHCIYIVQTEEPASPPAYPSYSTYPRGARQPYHHNQYNNNRGSGAAPPYHYQSVPRHELPYDSGYYDPQLHYRQQQWIQRQQQQYYS